MHVLREQKTEFSITNTLFSQDTAHLLAQFQQVALAKKVLACA